MAGVTIPEFHLGRTILKTPTLKREMIVAAVEDVLKKSHSAFSPDVYCINWQGRRAVWKDYGACSTMGRLWGRFVIAREARALATLQDLKGVPHLLALVERTGLIMEFIEGDILPRRGVREKITSAFFDQAFRLLLEIHEQGVAHGDVRRKNILIHPSGAPLFIDFQTAILVGRSWLSRWFFGLMCRVDQWNLLRIKARSFPCYMTAEERQFLEHPPLLLRVGRFLRRRVYRAWRDE